MSGIRVGNDQWNADRAIVKEVFVSHPVIAEIITVISREHHHGILQQIALLHKLKQLTQLIINLFDQPHIYRDDRLACLVFGKRFTADSVKKVF